MTTLKRRKNKRNKTMKKGGKKKGPNKVFISAREMEKKISLSCPVCNNNKF